MRLRIALPADIPALHALIENAFRGDSAKRGWTHEADLLGGQRTDVEALAEIIADPKQILLLAVDERGLLGCVSVADQGEGVGYLGMLTVSPNLQSGGIGRTLAAAAEAHARNAFVAHTMEMTVISRRTELIAWYLRQGYVDTGREKPFPLDDPRFGLPKTRDLKFVVLAKPLH
jgi:ribosomal protein S18 acetylase RimI-like enzyme